jgi:hypothetical protein
MYVIAYGGGKFVAGGQTGYTSTSTDGILWTNTKSVGIGEIQAIAYGGTAGQEKFIVSGGDYNVDIAYSSDGSTWTKVSNPLGSQNINAIAWSMTSLSPRVIPKK